MENMNLIVTHAHRKSGDHVRTTVAPANVMGEPHFGMVDGLILFSLLCFAGALIYWILG